MHILTATSGHEGLDLAPVVVMVVGSLQGRPGEFLDGIHKAIYCLVLLSAPSKHQIALSVKHKSNTRGTFPKLPIGYSKKQNN